MKFKINLRQKPRAGSLFLLALLYASGMQIMYANKVDVNILFESIIQSTVSGVVSDDTGTPLPGASVVVKGTTTGTVTDFDGNYSIEVVTGGTLVFSYIGYKTVEVSVDGKSTINTTLPIDATQLDDVVVVGYGTQKKSEVTSSISQINGKDFQTSTASNAAMALQGRASGVEFVNSGTPGSTPSIRIRGVGTINNSQPLIVLDGVPVGSEILAQLASSEIQSVEILKDAASGAIYGTRAANGVVLITTNNARFNEKTTVRLNASTGFNSVINKYPVTNAEQLYELKRERYTMDGLPIDPNSPWADEYYNQTRTDWQEEMFRDGIFQDYNMNISGGSEKSTINANIFYRDEEGTQINTYFKRLGISLRGTQKISDRFRIEENIRITNNHSLLTQDDGATGTSQTIYSSYRFMPAIPVKYEDGSYGSGQASTQLGDMWNPVYKAKEEWRHRYKFNTLISMKADYDFTDELTLTARASYQKSTSKYEAFQNITPNQSRTENLPILRINTDETTVTLGELFTSYKKTSGLHNIGAVLGISGQVDKGNYLNMSGEGFASVDENQLVMDNAAIIRGNGNDYLATGLASAFVRGTYGYNDKYYLSAIFRADGSSRFADGNRWGYFPSISGGWRISNESFMENSATISNMKLNVGWGQLGNQNVSAFQYLNVYSKNVRYVLNDTNLTGTRLASFANPDITWETTSALNVLLELGLFNNKFNLDVAYFDRLTSDMLIPLPGLNTAGLVAIPDSNIGEMHNSGFEIEPSYAGQLGELSFELGVNATLIKNEVTKLYGSSKFISVGEGQTRTYEGDPISSFFGWKTDGIYQNQAEIDNDTNISSDSRRADITPGDVRFVDTNGDNIVDEQDRVRIGDANPKLLLGFHADLKYKGFDFSAVFSGAFGHDLYDAMMMRGIDPTQSANMDAVAYQRWTGEGTSNTYPRMSTIRANDNYRVSELGLKSGNYLRMKDVVLGYTIPESITEQIGVSNMKFYISGRNLLTFTNFDGVDPEESGTNNLTRGVIFNNYPQSKSVVLGANITF